MRKVAFVLAASGLLLVAAGVCSFWNTRHQRELLRELSRHQSSINAGSSSVGVVEEARREGKIYAHHLDILVEWLERNEWHRVEYAVYRWFPSFAPPWKPELRMLAILGFEILGTNAAPAVPELAKLARLPVLGDYFVNALVPIGESSWETGRDLAKSQLAHERKRGTYLLGALRVRPEETLQILKGLLNDSDSAVRNEAITALTEFPSEETENLFARMIADSSDNETLFNGVYGLHTGGANATRRLILLYEESPIKPVRAAVLAAFKARENVALFENTGAGFRDSVYRSKRPIYNAAALQIAHALYTDLDADLLWRNIKSNLLSGADAKIDRELSRSRKSK